MQFCLSERSSNRLTASVKSSVKDDLPYRGAPLSAHFSRGVRVQAEGVPRGHDPRHRARCGHDLGDIYDDVRPKEDVLIEQQLPR